MQLARGVRVTRTRDPIRGAPRAADRLLGWHNCTRVHLIGLLCHLDALLDTWLAQSIVVVRRVLGSWLLALSAVTAWARQRSPLPTGLALVILTAPLCVPGRPALGK